jgi:hypothetical protein
MTAAVTHVFVYPDDWNGLNDHSRREYTASAEEHGIEMRVAHPASPNPDQLVTVSNGDFTALAAPYYFGPASVAGHVGNTICGSYSIWTIRAFRARSVTTLGRFEPSNASTCP